MKVYKHKILKKHYTKDFDGVTLNTPPPLSHLLYCFIFA